MLDTIGNKLGNIFSSITQGFSSIGGKITSSINSVITAIGNIVSDLIDSLLDLLKSLFIPSENFFKDKIDDLVAEFSFVESIVGTVSVLSDYLENTDFSQPPNVVISLALNKSKYNYGESALAIDFSWYEPYKPTVDIVLSAIFYLNFIVAVFKDLPNIIQGVGGGMNSYNEFDSSMSSKVESDYNDVNFRM